MGALEERYAVGKIGEGLIAAWLRKQGWNVLPVYQKEINEGKAPMLFTTDSELIAPDLFCFRKFARKTCPICEWEHGRGPHPCTCGQQAEERGRRGTTT